MKKNSDTKNIIITGLSGQGVLSLAKTIAALLLEKNIDFIVGNIYGESQRGGSVSVHIRIGNRVSPMMPSDAADLIVSLEEMEALRQAVQFLSPTGTVVLGDYRHPSLEVTAGEFNYPSTPEIIQSILRLGKAVYRVNATDHALRLGNPVLTNTIILGALIVLELLPFDRQTVARVIVSKNPANKDLNLAAFNVAFENDAIIQHSHAED